MFSTPTEIALTWSIKLIFYAFAFVLLNLITESMLFRLVWRDSSTIRGTQFNSTAKEKTREKKIGSEIIQSMHKLINWSSPLLSHSPVGQIAINSTQGAELWSIHTSDSIILCWNEVGQSRRKVSTHRTSNGESSSSDPESY